MDDLYQAAGSGLGAVHELSLSRTESLPVTQGLRQSDRPSADQRGPQTPSSVLQHSALRGDLGRAQKSSESRSQGEGR